METNVDRRQRKTKVGVVVSDRMQKTVVVNITQTIRHPLYGKIYKRNTKLHAHDAQAEAKVGDRVMVAETRPISKTKRWRVVKILEKAK